MGYITWSDRYSVQVTEIDEQHRKLFSLANGLYEAMEQGKGQEVLDRVLAEFTEYTRYHFRAEERLLKANFYPEYDEHHEMHESISRKVHALKEAFDRGSRPTAIEVMLLLSNWLNNHVLEEDRKYKPFIRVMAAPET